MAHNSCSEIQERMDGMRKRMRGKVDGEARDPNRTRSSRVLQKAEQASRGVQRTPSLCFERHCHDLRNH
jgi:hypothetical protein